MSEENVELVRRAYERFNANDVDGFLALCATDIEFRDLPDLPGSGLFEGRDGFRAWWSQLVDAFEDLRFDPDDLTDSGDRVFAMNRATGLGKGSGARVEMEMYNVWTITDGRVTRLDTYADRAEALTVAGLSE